MRYEALKSEMNLCTGTRMGYGLTCRGTLYKCAKCGNTGCKQNRGRTCSNQAFDVEERCLSCGETGQMQVVQ